MSRAPRKELEERLARARSRARELRGEIESRRAERCNGWLSDLASPARPSAPVPCLNDSAVRRVMTGHMAKVYCVRWSGALPGNQHDIVSVSNRNELILWNGVSGLKRELIRIPNWAMTCDIEPQQSRLLASGGLDNECSMYTLDDDRNSSTSSPAFRLSGHIGYVSEVRILPGGAEALTASGDSTCALWDLERATAVHSFQEHTADCSCIAPSPVNTAVFVSGSCDSAAKVWDSRTGHCTATFRCHESDVNAVTFLPGGNCFATGSADSSCGLFDIRCGSTKIATFHDSTNRTQITSLDASAGSRLLFGGFMNGRALAWDVLRPDEAEPAAVFQHSDTSGDGGGETYVYVAINATGEALATGAWDMQIKVWA